MCGLGPSNVNDPSRPPSVTVNVQHFVFVRKWPSSPVKKQMLYNVNSLYCPETTIAAPVRPSTVPGLATCRPAEAAAAAAAAAATDTG